MPVQKKRIESINLLIKDDIGYSYFDQILTWVLTYGRYIVILTQIVVLSVFFLRFKLDRDHTDLKEDISQRQAIVESQSISDMETDIRRIQSKLSYIRTISDKQDLPMEILNFFENHIPSDTFFYSLSISNEKISFNAASNGLYSFSFLLRELQKDKKFTEVTLEDIQRRTDGRIEYKVNAKVNPQEFS